MDDNTYIKSHNLLSCLVGYLVRNYPDDHWDDTTLELLEEANNHLGEPDIEWDLDYSTEELNEH